jgi:hypothetical protein
MSRIENVNPVVRLMQSAADPADPGAAWDFPMDDRWKAIVEW